MSCLYASFHACYIQAETAQWLSLALVQTEIITGAKTPQFRGDLQVVEATVAAGKLVHKVDIQAPERAVAPIAGMGVILPTFLTVMHGQDNWKGLHVSQVYGDHTSWDAPFLIDLLGRFFQIT